MNRCLAITMFVVFLSAQMVYSMEPRISVEGTTFGVNNEVCLCASMKEDGNHDPRYFLYKFKNGETEERFEWEEPGPNGEKMYYNVYSLPKGVKKLLLAAIEAKK